MRGTLVVALAVCAAGCASSKSSDDADAAPDFDATPDFDAASPTTDAPPPDARGPDGGMSAGACETCTSLSDCLPDHLCIDTGAGRVCLPRCTPSDPNCPDDFTCGGVKATYCAPIDGVCCIDADDDGYGSGAACLGADCDDDDGDRHPDADELCDGVDNDCDAATADGSGDPAIGGGCDGPDSDLCEEGTLSCSGGGPVCDDATGDDLELCNGADDDCNPSTADGSGDSAVGVLCDGDDGDLCDEGVTVCSGGRVVCDDETSTTVDLCNGVDDDCDPSSADGSEDDALGASCDGPDSDLCEEGVTECVDGAPECNDATSSTLDICNGADDDCDASSADGSEDPSLGVACDGTDSDLCEEGVTICSGGSPACGDETGDTLEVCNTLDDDCDGLTDETFDFSSDENNCGSCGNECAGATATCCGGTCVDVASDEDFCGDCATACSPVESCCDGTCSDTDTDPLNCGACGDGCSAGAPDCCSGSCTDTASDVDNCGACGDTCGDLCCTGTCTPSSVSDCGACGEACFEGMLVVTELMINPSAVTDAQGEWFELYNPNAFAVDLRGFVLSDLGSDSHTITASAPLIVPAGSYMVLAINADPASNGGVTGVLYQYSGIALGNSGDELLVTAHGQELDRVEWTGTFDPAGASRELSVNHLTHLFNDVLGNWCVAVSVFGDGDFGTPGTLNDCAL